MAWCSIDSTQTPEVLHAQVMKAAHQHTVRERGHPPIFLAHALVAIDPNVHEYVVGSPNPYVDT